MKTSRSLIRIQTIGIGSLLAISALLGQPAEAAFKVQNVPQTEGIEPIPLTREIPARHARRGYGHASKQALLAAEYLKLRQQALDGRAVPVGSNTEAPDGW